MFIVMQNLLKLNNQNTKPSVIIEKYPVNSEEKFYV